jgi:carbonic anhydrase/acetyltransferase-like protein (isoleucine patch superfamily)
VLRGDLGPIRVGARTSIQDNAVMHCGPTGVRVGDDCVVGHLAHLESATVEDVCMVGIAALVLHEATLRTGSVVAAGAVLVGGLEVPSGMRAQGVPARIIEGTHDREWILHGASVYAEQTRRRLGASSTC